jgi:hypothetical protein
LILLTVRAAVVVVAAQETKLAMVAQALHTVAVVVAAAPRRLVLGLALVALADRASSSSPTRL